MAEKPPVLTEGQRRFDEFIRVNELSLVVVGEALGVSDVTVMNWRKGLARPVDSQRAKIEVWTGGSVSAPTWRTPEEREEIAQVQPFTTQVAS